MTGPSLEADLTSRQGPSSVPSRCPSPLCIQVVVVAMVVVASHTPSSKGPGSGTQAPEAPLSVQREPFGPASKSLQEHPPSPL